MRSNVILDNGTRHFSQMGKNKYMLKLRATFFILGLVVYTYLSIRPVAAQEVCGFDCDTLQDKNNIPACLQNVIKDCENNLKEANVKKQTLQSALTYLDNKINLTQVQINQTVFEIGRLQTDINTLDGNITNLDLNLDQITMSLSEKVKRSYKNSRISKVSLFVSADGFADFFAHYKYLKTTQQNDRKAIFELEKIKNNLSLQKNTKEEKKSQVLGLQTQLQTEKNSLASQQKDKSYLLNVTKGEESRYQDLLTQNARKLAAFSRFVSSQGGATILNGQTKCDGWGCYYNQRDALWGNIGLGGSQYSVAEYGCFVTSVAMLASHYGKNIKPNEIAVNPSAFEPGAYLRHEFSVNGISVSIRSASKSLLDSELAAGRPVIAGLYSGPDHFIVIVKKEGDAYIMHDPYLENGGNRPLTDKYSVNDITSLRLVSFN